MRHSILWQNLLPSCIEICENYEDIEYKTASFCFIQLSSVHGISPSKRNSVHILELFCLTEYLKTLCFTEHSEMSVWGCKKLNLKTISMRVLENYKTKRHIMSTKFKFIKISNIWSRYSIVSTAISYERGVWVRVPVGSRIFSSACFPGWFWVHLNPIQWVPGSLSPEVK
jgi:hypothetical protein